ncbi:MAG: sulfotransferase [Planctomycetota bacterium]
MKFPLLISGPSSGGTHLLATMLDMHPALAAGPEIWLLAHREVFADWRVAQPEIVRALRSTHNPISRFARARLKIGTRPPQGRISSVMRSIQAYGLTPTQTESMIRDASSLKEFFERFADRFMQQRDKHHGPGHGIWMEKTLDSIYRYDEIRAIWPETRVIVLARDGRDSCSSVIRRGSEPFPAYARWLARLSAADSVRRRGDHVLVLRYEDLVDQTEQTLRTACDFLDIEFVDEMLTPERNEFWKQQTQYHGTWGATPTGGTISTKSIGAYTKRLTPEQISLFWAVGLTRYGLAEYGAELVTTADVMRTFGYQPEPGDEWTGLDGFEPTLPTTARLLAERYFEIREH